MVADPPERLDATEPAAPPLPRPAADAPWRDRIQDWRERLVDAVEDRRAARVVAALLAMALATGAGAWLLWPERARPPVEEGLPVLGSAEVSAANAPAAAVGGSPTPGAQIVVHVAGAVVSPGLVELPADSRVADAIAAAGGPSGPADLDRINLAATVADASRVYVPVEGEVVSEEELSGGVAEGAGPLDVNRATAAQLEALPGIGPATAAAIIDHRDQHGPFTSVSGLEAVSGIGPAKLARLRDLVTVSR